MIEREAAKGRQIINVPQILEHLNGAAGPKINGIEKPNIGKDNEPRF
jgi:hypothetical protein